MGFRLRVVYVNKEDVLRAAAVREDMVYNLIRPLKTLRLEVGNDQQRRWFPRTPAMAAGLTDHIWTVKELLTLVPLPTGNTERGAPKF